MKHRREEDREEEYEDITMAKLKLVIIEVKNIKAAGYDQIAEIIKKIEIWEKKSLFYIINLSLYNKSYLI